VTAPAVVLAAGMLVSAAVWLGLFRVTYLTVRIHNRIGLWIGGLVGLPGPYAFSIAATVWYVVLGVAVAAVVGHLAARPFLGPLVHRLPPSAALAVGLGILGAFSLTAAAMTVISAVRPSVDVATAVSKVRWIEGIMRLPAAWRWVVPMIGASVEEYVFRGVMYPALLAHGVGRLPAFAVATGLFTAEQIGLTENLVQAIVIGISSLVVGGICTLLWNQYHSVVPAIAVHASFAGFYTSLSWRR
jgi:hypothetical protein